MIFSKDIINNLKFPYAIRMADIFRIQSKFEKIFPHIGLNNFKSSIKDSGWKIPFIFSHGAFSGKVLAPQNVTTWRKIGFRVCATPLAMAINIVDAARFYKFRFKNKNLKIVFSSDQLEGAWDIATMSMRGIHSCMRWDSGKMSNLVGSVIDPCCGIIYITDDSEYGNYGSRMLYRSVVRYVVHQKFGPAIFLERSYAGDAAHDDNENTWYMINFLFASILHKQTGLPIILPFTSEDNHVIRESAFIPESTTIKKSSYSSYRDSGISYKPITKQLYKDFPSLTSFKDKFFK